MRTWKAASLLSALVALAPTDAGAGAVEEAEAARKTGNLCEAMRLLREGADLGDAEAQYKAAQMFQNRECVGRKKLAETQSFARIYYRKAAEQGHVGAQYDLGLSYEQELLGNRNYRLAADMWRRLAERDNAVQQEARMNLARLHEKGLIDGSPDLVEAYVWYLRASEKGGTEARTALTTLGPKLLPHELAEAQRRAGLSGPAAASPGPGLDAEQLRRVVQEAVKGAAPAAASAAPSWSSEVDTPTYKSATRPEDFAVVVGVEAYADLPAAEFAERDAEAFRRHLLALGVPQRNIVTLTGARASRAGLVKTLENFLPSSVKAHSRVIFYYSGHGAPNAESGRAYLLPADGDPQYLEETAYPLSRLYEKLGRLKAKSVLVVLDACFSGAGGRSVLPRGVRPLVTKIDVGTPLPGKVLAMTASGAAQISGAAPEQGHGLFTYYFLKGLGGEAADSSGAVSAKALHEYLSPLVQDEARRSNRAQTPQLLPADPAAAEGFRLR